MLRLSRSVSLDPRSICIAPRASVRQRCAAVLLTTLAVACLSSATPKAAHAGETAADTSSRDALTRLVAMALDESLPPRRRAGVVAQLGSLGDDRALPTLSILVFDDSPDVALAAVDALARIGGDDAWAALDEAAGDPSRPDAVREAARDHLSARDAPATDSAAPGDVPDAPPPMPAPAPVETPPETVVSDDADLLPPPVTPSASHAARARDHTLPEADRRDAIAALVEIDGPGAVDLLLDLLRDRRRAVQQAALDALCDLSDVRAQSALLEVIGDARFDFQLREGAVAGIGRQGLPDAAEHLERLHGDETLPRPLRLAAHRALQAHAPERAAALPLTPGTRGVDRTGQVGMAVGGSVIGGYAGLSLGLHARNPEITVLSLLVGASVGGAGAYVRGRDASQPRALAFFTAGGLGAWTGLGLGYASLGRDATPAHVNTFGLVGALAFPIALEASWPALGPHLDPADGSRGGEMLLTFTGAMIGGVALNLVGQLPHEPDLRSFATMNGLFFGAATGFVVGRAVERERGALLATGGLWGLGIGALGGVALLPPDAEIWQLQLGALGGSVAGMTLAAFPERTLQETLLINVLGLTGFSAGLGAAMLAEVQEPRIAALTVAGTTTLGLATGALVAPHLSMDPGATALVGLGLAHGTVSGYMLPGLVDDNPSFGRQLGGSLLGASAGVLLGGTASQIMDVEPADVAILYGADALGATAGLGVGLLATGDRAIGPSTGLLAGGTAALVATAPFARRMHFDTGRLAIVSLGATMGGWNGLLLGRAGELPHPRNSGATLLGIGAGGLAAGALSQRLDADTAAVAATGWGGIWGATLAHLAFLSFESDEVAARRRSVVLSGDGTLVLTAALLGLTPMRPAHVHATTLGGVAGIVVFPLVRFMLLPDGSSNFFSVLFIPDPASHGPMARTMLLGATTGLLGGALVAGYFVDAEPDADAYRSRRITDTRASEHAARGLFGARLEGVASTPWQGRAGETDGALFTAVFSLR